MKRVFIALLVVMMFSLASCASDGDPSKAVTDYLQAKVDGDSDKLAGLLCAEMEAFLPREANSFSGVEASLIDVSCESGNSEGDSARVTCSGHVFVDYGEEESELPLSAYRVVKEDGEWKWCGEAQ